MGLLDDYLNNDSSTKSAAPEIKSSGLIDQYLNTPNDTKRVYIPTNRPPISGVSKDASDEINAAPTKVGGANPRDQEVIDAIRNIPSNVGTAIEKDFKEGLSTASEGASDILSNKPASGIGKSVMGGLAAAVSPITGASKELIAKPVTELTGNKKAGEIADFVATSGIPIVKVGKLAVSKIPTNRAFKTLVDSIGPENAGNVAKAMRDNPRLSPADLSAKVKQDTQHLFTVDGPHINYLDNAVKGRTEGAKSAVEGAMDASLGSTVNAVDKLAELKQNIRNVGSQKINPAIEGSKPVDVSGVVKGIDDILKPGVNSVISSSTELASPEVNKQLALVRKYLSDNKSMRSDPDQLNNIQSALRSKAEALMNSSSGQDRQIGGALMKVRNGIVDAIDTASGGKYKKALSDYRDEFHIQDAFEHGHDAIITNSKAITNRPEFFKEWVKKSSPEELEAAKEGARIAIDTQINGFKHAARRGTDVGEVDFNRQRIETLFGKDEADKLFTKLKHERDIADTNNKLIQGSQTAMRNAAKSAFDMPTKSDIGKNALATGAVEAASMLTTGTPGIGTGLFLGAKGAMAVKDAISLKLAKEHNANYAKYALPTEGPSRDELIRQLEAVSNRPAKQSIVRRAASLANAIAP